MRWRIYYGDGSTFCDRDGDQWKAPATGVQVVAVEIRGHVQLCHGKNVYIWRDGLWIGCDEAGFYDYLMTPPEPKRVLFGRSIRTDSFWKIVERASKEGVG
jgi:hypothetical protein